MQRPEKDQKDERREQTHSHAVAQDVAFPLQAVGEAAAAELAGEALLHATRPRAADGRPQGFWEIEFQ